MSNNKYAILELVLQTCYPVNMRDYIINIAHEINSMNPSTKTLKVNYKNDMIILLKLNISTQFKGKNYDIPVLIYLSKGMPYESPEVYLERQPETAVNPKNTDIDQKTNRILTKSLINWNSYFSLSTIIEEIQKSFSTTFPIYKVSQNQQQSINQNLIQQSMMYNNTNTNINPYSNMGGTGIYTGYQPIQGQSGLQNTVIPGGYINTQPAKGTIYNTIYQSMNPNTGISSTTSVTSSYSQNTIYPQPTQNIWSTMIPQQNMNNPNPNTNINQIPVNQYGYNNTNMYPNNNNSNPYVQPLNNPVNYQNQINPYMPNQFNNIPNNQPQLDPKRADEEVKKILIAEIVSNTETKIKEEIKRNKQQDEKLKNYKNQFNSQIEKYKKFLSRKEEIIKLSDGYVKNAENEIVNIQNYLSKIQDRIVNSSNYDNFIFVSHMDVVKIISIEATIEDIIVIVKKAFEKNIINFNETSRIIRSLTREAFKIKYYREKLIKSI